MIIKEETPSPTTSPLTMDRRQPPKIEGEDDLLLDLYTHRSLQKLPMQDNDYGDTARLAILGEKILEATIMDHLFKTRRTLRASDLKDVQATILKSDNYDIWLEQHNLKSKLLFDPSAPNPLHDPKEMQDYFHSYVGAVFLRSGYEKVHKWIRSLIDPDEEFSDTVGQQAGPSTSTPAPPSYFQSHQPNAYTPLPVQPPQPPQPPQPAAMPPPVPSQPPPPSQSPPRLNGIQFIPTLALVNQTAVQRGLQISYEADSVGPPHQPTWTVRCLINGTEQGRGTGRNQKQAKEEAARQAWQRLGW